MARYIAIDYEPADTWEQLRPTDNPRVKWIGSRLMDREQFTEEGWERVGDRWVAEIAKVEARHQRLLKERRARKSRWQQGIEQDAQFRRDYPALVAIEGGSDER